MDRTVVHLVRSLETGGIQSQLTDQVSPLRDRGWTTVVGSFADGPARHSLEAAGATVQVLEPPTDRAVRHPTSWARQVGAARRAVVDLARRSNAAVVDAHMLQNLDVVLPHGDVAVVSSMHNERLFPAAEGRSPVAGAAYRWLLRRTAARADAVIAVSDAVADALRRAGVTPVEVIHNGVVLGRGAGGAGHRVRAELGVGADPLVLAVGRLAAQKGHRHLLDAWRSSSRDHPQAHLVIVGSGPLEEPLQRRVDDLGLATIQLAGERDDVPDLLAAADLFVSASVHEGLPLAVLEAMASAVPVVATAVGGVPEVIRDGREGLLVEPRQAGALATAISGLLADPERRARLGRAGQARVADAFSIERTADRRAALYDRVAHPADGGPAAAGRSAPGHARVAPRYRALLPDGESPFAVFAAHCLAQVPGVSVVATSTGRIEPIRFSRACDEVVVTRSTDDADRVTSMQATVRDLGVDVVLPTSTDAVEFIVAHRAQLAGHVSLPPLPEGRWLTAAQDKWQLAQLLADHGIPTPPTVAADAELLEGGGLADVQFPVLVKPARGWGGEGIHRAEHAGQLRSILGAGAGPGLPGGRIVQTLRRGSVVGVNVLARRGDVLAAATQRPLIRGSGYASAGAVELGPDEDAVEIATRLVAETGFSGYANIDLVRLEDTGALEVLDVNARIWGSVRASLAAGVNFPHLACLAALGVPFDPPPVARARYAHSKTAVSSWASALVRPTRLPRLRFSETGLVFLARDPVAEAWRALRQEYRR